jgi:hypothetical protein
MSKQSDLVKVSDGDGSALTSLSAPNLTGTVASARMPAGSVLQVVNVLKTDTTSTNSQSFVDISGLSVAITPSSTSSKILVIVAINYNVNGHGSLRLMRDAAPIGIGDAGNGSQTRTTFQAHSPPTWTHKNDAMTVLDSPNTTSPTTYKLQFAVPWSSGYTVYLNRGVSDDTNSYSGRSVSSITVMEISA